jgi:hypothetical protein
MAFVQFCVVCRGVVAQSGKGAAMPEKLVSRGAAVPAVFPRIDLQKPLEAVDRFRVLDEVYSYVEAFGSEQLRWYKEKKRLLLRQVASLWIRFVSLLFLLVGFLCPLLPSRFSDWITDWFRTPPSQFGYFMIAFGGGLLLFDRLFGVSSSWMRFAWAHLEIEGLLDEFRIAWLKTRLLAADNQEAVESSSRLPSTPSRRFMEPSSARRMLGGASLVVISHSRSIYRRVLLPMSRQTQNCLRRDYSGVPAVGPMF